MTVQPSEYELINIDVREIFRSSESLVWPIIAISLGPSLCEYYIFNFFLSIYTLFGLEHH